MPRQVTVFSNDPKTPRFVLNISANVEVVVGFEPSRLDLGRVLAGTTAEKVARIVAKDPAALHPDGVSSTDPAFTAELVEGPAVKVRFVAPKIPRPYVATVTLQTGNPQVPQATLTVTGTVSVDVVAEPTFVSFAPPPAGQPAPTVEVKIHSLSGRPFKVSAVKDPDGAVSGTAAKDGDGAKVTLRLDHAPTKPSGTVRVETDRADQGPIEVRYAVRMVKAPSPARMPAAVAPHR